MEKYNRTCPDCNKKLLYTNYKTYYSAKSRNSICKSCRTIRANKSTKRDNSRSRNVNWKGYKEIPYNWFSKYFLRNKKSKRTGSITIIDVYNLWIKQNKKCALSNINIGFYDIENKYHSCSIDRINSDLEYDINNIQLVHKDINIMKNKYKQSYFIKICKLITKNNE